MAVQEGEGGSRRAPSPEYLLTELGDSMKENAAAARHRENTYFTMWTLTNSGDQYCQG